MKFIFLFELSPQWQAGLERLKAEFPNVEFITKNEQRERDMVEAEALIAGMVTKEQLEKARTLKAFFLTYTGANFLPMKELATRGVRVFNTHGNAQSVAERGVALALAYYGRIIDYHNDLKTGKWHGGVGRQGVGGYMGVFVRQALCPDRHR